ncbi:YicC/YloC family endoribonuclease [Bacillus sp. FJAT-45037]|uniref:YicC/YloC family endoribonuclease n=1 Tax=Bacillus sp. FJAT-45037 TaxID=2011007 RepID=UPI0012FDEC5C|nr:YicC/YloC family endoribonuclease [Bacillus sp. FJAT-45037]
MRSMTGYGRCSNKENSFSVTIEAKVVNHRFFECSIRIPQMFMSLEEEIRSYVHKSIKRGKVDLYVHIEKNNLLKQRLEIDYGLLDEYVKVAADIKSHSKEVTGTLDLHTLLLQDQLIKRVEEESQSFDEGKTMILTSVQSCVDALVETKEREGNELKQDLLHQIELLTETILRMEQLAPDVNLIMQTKFKERMTSALNHITEDLQDRIIAEASVYAEKADVNEELVRLRAHLVHFREICESEPFPIGRKLDFLVQEMNREVNTIGAKVNDALVRQLVVTCKSYIEKMKEQVQNIE